MTHCRPGDDMLMVMMPGRGGDVGSRSWRCLAVTAACGLGIACRQMARLGQWQRTVLYWRLAVCEFGDLLQELEWMGCIWTWGRISVWGLCIYQTGAGVSRRHGPVYIGMTLGPLYLRLGPEYLSVWGRGIYQAGTGRWCPSERGGLWL